MSEQMPKNAASVPKLEVALGMRSSATPVPRRCNSLEVTIYLRHDPSSDHWAGIECSRFGNLRKVLEANLRAMKGAPSPDDARFLPMLDEIIAERDALPETLSGIEDPAFAKWLCRTAFHRNHYSFAVRVVNEFPVTEKDNHISLASRVFQKDGDNEILKQATPGMQTQIRGFLRFWDRRKSDASADIGKAFASLGLPVHDAVFGLTEITETRGDDLFRYVIAEPLLGEGMRFRIVAKRDLKLDLNRVEVNGKMLPNGGAAGDSVPLPALEEKVFEVGRSFPVADFENCVKGNGFSLKLSVTDSAGEDWCPEYRFGEGTTLSLSIPETHRGAPFRHAALFVDMGSTYSKTLLVETTPDGAFRTMDLDKSSCKKNSTTLKFLERFGLKDLVAEALKLGPSHPLAREDVVSFKGIMADNPERYADFLAEAIKSLARHWLEENTILDSVCWSFPQMDKRPGDFFGEVEKTVREKIAGYVRKTGGDSFRLYPEHEALRCMFDAPIGAIAKQALAAGKTIDGKYREIDQDRTARDKVIIQDRDARLQKLGFLSSLFKSSGIHKQANRELEDSSSKARQEKDETMRSYSDWFETGLLFLRLLDSDLRGELPRAYVDAGGYSLDSVVRWDGADSGDGSIQELTKSFACGGEQIVKLIHEHQGTENPTDKDDRRVRDGLKTQTYNMDGWFQKILASVYGEYTMLFKRLIHCNGLPLFGISRLKPQLGFMVFSGGVSRNKEFLKLFTPKLASATLGMDKWGRQYGWGEVIPPALLKPSIESPKISSIFLFNLAKEILQDNTNETLAVFQRIVKHPDNGEPCETFDIVGGMLQNELRTQTF